MSFDPDDTATWPIPEHAVLTRDDNGKPLRVSEYGEGWLDGFERALDMADDFATARRWPS